MEKLNTKEAICDVCALEEPILSDLSWCSVCEMVMCGDCWDKQAVHIMNRKSSRVRAQKQAPQAHEKSSLGVADLIDSIFNGDKEDVDLGHETNMNTKWFGVMTDPNGGAEICNFDHFRALIYGSPDDNINRFPSLISFVGETGAGKSTLINALIKCKASEESNKHETITPVTGKSVDTATTGDVHLFSDPETFLKSRPLLYADCEGLNGGNIPTSGSLTHKIESITKLRDRVFPRYIKARSMTLKAEQDRQWVVNNLYPTILFTFSDTVCFVSRNIRKLEDHLTNLITWADRALDRSLNQPMLPHAVIVVNALEPGDNEAEKWWNGQSSNGLLSTLDSLVHDDGTTGTTDRKGKLAKFAKRWRDDCKKEIKNLEQLLLCYYSKFTLICIPHSTHPPNLIHKQYQGLYNTLNNISVRSLDERKSAGLLMTSVELDRYFELALEHFSKEPERPFNFLDSALRHNPIEPSFEHHVLNFLVCLVESLDPAIPKATLLDLAAFHVGSCIFLALCRCRYPYRKRPNIVIEGYEELCLKAVKEFDQKYWPCEKKDRKGRRCANTASGHIKGHQTRDGKVFGMGPYTSESVYPIEQFKEGISRQRDIMFEKQALRTEEKDEARHAAYLHTNNVRCDIFKQIKAKNSLSCFCCLTSIPTHPLKCGHLLCENCIEDLSTTSECGVYHELIACPLCYDPKLKTTWSPGWRTKIESPAAGVRILSLDGGGIRSIIQLVALEVLEDTIGLGVPIQDFFDLIIGTSGGGIVAFGIGLKELDVKSCAERFRVFAEKAFKCRTGGRIPFWGTIVKARHHGMYETRGVKEVFKTVFGTEPLFGTYTGHAERSPTKVGVTATSSSYRNTFLLTNYNRKITDTTCEYSFFRGTDEKMELTVEEALRATTASPTYFKPFFHKGSGNTFVDGGIRYNNPVEIALRESKYLWPHFEKNDPDILLSIGTGFDPDEGQAPEVAGSKPAQGIRAFATDILRLVKQNIQDGMNSEKIWKRFSSNFYIDGNEKKRRYCRLNPEIKDLPKIDAVDRMGELEKKARKAFEGSQEVNHICATLIASLFYFEEIHGSDVCIQEGGARRYRGVILCRLEAGSDQLKALCKRLLGIINTPKSSLFFRRYQVDDHHNFRYVALENSNVREICQRIVDSPKGPERPPRFELSISILVSNNSYEAKIYMCVEKQYLGGKEDDEDKYVLISGFPRSLDGHIKFEPYSRRLYQENFSKSSLTRRLSRASTLTSSSSTDVELSYAQPVWRDYWESKEQCTEQVHEVGYMASNSSDFPDGGLPSYSEIMALESQENSKDESLPPLGLCG